MNHQAKTFELYGQVFTLAPNKVATNEIRLAFSQIADHWLKTVIDGFYTRFSNLDDLYENSSDLADEARSSAVEQGMKFLAAYGIYHISEQQFYEQFMAPYDSWEDDFDAVASQYEEIVQHTEELDAHRTARRKNRRQWVGYTKQGVYEADGKNLISNVGHGVFNLMAKGVTAIGNAIKKDQIFKDSATLETVAKGITSIVSAGIDATITAINSEQNGALYEYSDDEFSKSRAIVENIDNGRVPPTSILPSLIKAIEFCPYDREIYVQLLTNFGGDKSRLDEICEYFGIGSLLDYKKELLQAKLKAVDLSTLEGCKKNIPLLKEYAQYLCYQEFDEEANRYLDNAVKAEFDKKIRTLDLSSLSGCKESLPQLRAFADEIGYPNFDVEWSKVLNKATENDFLREASKYPLDTADACDSNLPLLESFASEIDYANFQEWARQTRSAAKIKSPVRVAPEPLSAQHKPRARKVVTAILVLSLIVLAFVWSQNESENSVEASQAAANTTASDAPSAVASVTSQAEPAAASTTSEAPGSLPTSTPVPTSHATCDTMPAEIQVKNCWMGMIGNAMEIAENYWSATMASSQVPENVKDTVSTEYHSIKGEVQQHCKDTDYKCRVKHYENFADFAYKETSKYGVPDKRLN